MNRKIYQEPLVGRYTSEEMQYLFSDEFKFTTWRKCWIALAEAQLELGLDTIIDQEMIEQMKDHQNTIDYELAA
ncbi:MAG: adenylosuccinate lyase, partial [Desulfopila sp.]|nr:adenylosuccinate lyase [Desulfopila sp.]